MRERPQKKSATLPASTDKLSPAECEEFAEAFADKVLDSSFAPLRPGLIMVIRNPEKLKTMAGYMGLSVPVASPDPGWKQDFADAIERLDRERLIELLKLECLKNPAPRAEAEFITKFDFGALIRETYKQASRDFPAKRGAKAKIARRDYAKIAALARELYPVCLMVVTELRTRKNLSVQKCLERCKREFPEECSFLLAHLGSLESVLNDDRLSQRAKGIESFARLAADGIAGANYGLEPRTSIERAREGRRMLARKHR